MFTIWNNSASRKVIGKILNYFSNEKKITKLCFWIINHFNILYFPGNYFSSDPRHGRMYRIVLVTEEETNKIMILILMFTIICFSITLGSDARMKCSKNNRRELVKDDCIHLLSCHLLMLISSSPKWGLMIPRFGLISVIEL